MRRVMQFQLIFVLSILVAWGVNITQLLNDDFEPTYKSEVIHIIGVVVPPITLVTVWMDFK